MPIDPSIPLSVRPPQFTDPMQSLAGLQELRMRQQSIDTNTALMQERQVETQAKQRALDAQRTIGQLMQTAFKTDPDTGFETFDRDKLTQGMQKAGFGDQLPAISESLDKMDQSAMTMAAARRKLIAQTIFTVQQNGATPDAVKLGIAYLQKQHAITDDHANAMIQAIAANPDPQHINGTLTQLGSTLPEYRDLQNAEEGRKAGLEKTRAEAANLQATAGKTTTETAATQRQQDASYLAAAMNPGDYSARWNTLPAERRAAFPNAPSAWTPAFKAQIQQIGMTPDQQVTTAETRRHDLATEATAQGDLALKQKTFEAQYGGDRNPVTGQPYSDAEVKQIALQNPQAVMMAGYQIPGISSRNATDPKNRWLLRQVLTINPSYSADLFGTRKDFLTGSQGQQLTSLNTAIEHLGVLSEFADALHNGSFTPGNAIYNKVSSIFGNSAPTNFAFARDIMSGELATAMKKSGATDTEISKVQGALSGAGSPEQVQDAIRKVAIPMIGGKAQVLDEQYHKAMGAQDPFSVYTPGAKAVLDKFGGAPIASSTAAAGARIRVKGPNGESGTVPDDGKPLPPGWSKVSG